MWEYAFAVLKKKRKRKEEYKKKRKKTTAPKTEVLKVFEVLKISKL